MATKSRIGSPFTDARQLDLFSEPTGDELADNSMEESNDGRHERSDPARAPHSGALETLPAEDGRGSRKSEPAPASGFRGAGVDDQPALRIDGRAEDGLPDRKSVVEGKRV